MTNYVNSLFWLQWVVIQKTWKSRPIFYEIIFFPLELQRYENNMIFWRTFILFILVIQLFTFSLTLFKNSHFYILASLFYLGILR